MKKSFVDFILIISCVVLSFKVKAQDTASFVRAKDNITCLYGFKSFNKWVIEPQFETASELIFDYAIVSNNDVYGIIHSSGNIALPLEFDHIRFLRSSTETSSWWNSEEDLDAQYALPATFIVCKNDSCGTFNANTQAGLPRVYKEITHQENEISVVLSHDSLIGYIQPLNEIVKPQFNGGFPFQSWGTAIITHKGLYGVINRNGNVVIPPLLGSISYNYHGAARTIQNGKFGAIYKEKQVLEATYQDVIPIENHGFIIKQNNRFGFADTNGIIISKPTYSKIEAHPEQIAIVTRKDKLGIVCLSTGKEVQKPAYESITRINTNLILLKKNKKFGICNYSGQILKPCIFTNYAWDFNKNFILLLDNKTITCVDINSSQERNLLELLADEPFYILKNGALIYNKGLMNNQGKIVLKQEYEISRSGDYYLFRDSTGKGGLVDASGEIIYLSFPINTIEPFQNELAKITTASNSIGYINKKGNLVVDTIYHAVKTIDGIPDMFWVIPNSDETMNVKHTHEYCDIIYKLIDTNGNYVLNKSFSSIDDFQDSLAILSIDNKFGILHLNGTEKLPFIYDAIERQSNGCYLVRYENKFAIANAQAQLITPFIYNFISEFQENHALAIKGNYKGLISWEGSEIGSFQTEQLKNSDIDLKHFKFPYFEDNSFEGYASTDTALMKYKSKHSAYNTNLDFELLEGLKDLKLEQRINTSILEIIYDEHQFVNNEYEFNCMEHYFYFKNESIAYDEPNYSTYYLEIENISNASFSLIYTQVENYRYLFREFEYQNFAFINNEFMPITLDSIFLPSSNYKELLQELMIAAVKKNPNIEVDCSNTDSFYENHRHDFSLSSKALYFHFIIYDDERETDSPQKIEIPYSSFSSLIREEYKKCFDVP